MNGLCLPNGQYTPLAAQAGDMEVGTRATTPPDVYMPVAGPSNHVLGGYTLRHHHGQGPSGNLTLLAEG